MGLPIPITINLTDMSCGKCGGVYAINESVRQHHERNGTAWNCPYCRVGWGYSGKGRVQELEKALEAERLRKIAALDRANVAEAEKAKAERKLKRVSRGTCPECNRTFQNLGRHMNCKHAEATK